MPTTTTGPFTCQHCNKEFFTSYRLSERPTGPPKYCNQECYREARRLVAYPGRAMATCHPDRVQVAFGLCGTCYAKKHRKEHVENYRYAARSYVYQKTYKIDMEIYEDLLSAQQGKCAICGRTPEEAGKRKVLEVDHSHQTGLVRQLLCHMCNKGLGCFRDSIDDLFSAIAYLRLNEGLEWKENSS